METWKDVPAIRDRRVYVIRDELLNTPGPPLVEGARDLWHVLRATNEGERANEKKKITLRRGER